MADRNIYEGATDLVTTRVFSNGTELDGEFAIQSIFTAKEFNSLSTARIILQDGSIAEEDFPASNSDSLIPGAEIEIKIGYSGDEETIFKGIIIKQGMRSQSRAPSLLEITAKDAAFKMTIERKNKYFEDETDSDILEQIISDNSLTADVESTTAAHAEMVQYYVTDWDFLISRAEANGMLVLTDDGTVNVKKPDTSSNPVLDLVYGQNIIEFEAELDTRYQFSNVISKAWDFGNQEILEIEGNPPTLIEPGNLSSSDLAEVVGLDSYQMQHTGRLNNEELQNWSDAQHMRSVLSKIQGRIRIVGFSEVKPGDTITLGGLGDRFNGTAFVSGVYHSYGQQTNWYTDLQIGYSRKELQDKNDDVLDKESAGLLPGIKGLQIGVVTAIHDDPDGEDRIQVRLPILDPENSGVWSRVSTLDAGENRGSYFRPEVGDEVIVGFLNNDPRDPVVLGMVNSSAKPAPITAEEENNEKGFITRDNLKLIFNDDLKSITCETPNGNKITMSDDSGSIEMEDENGNKLIMNSDGISLESAGDIVISASGDVKIDGTNLENKANANFKAEGSAGIDINSSATTVIKGSLVQIN